MKTKDFKRLTVVSVADGAKLGRVENVYLNPADLCAAAVGIDLEGQHALVPFDQVRVGSDAVTIPSRDVARWPGGAGGGDAVTLDRIEELKVVDEAGTFLGKVHDVDVDPATGKMTGFEAHKGGVLGIGGERLAVTSGDVISVGKELVVVRAATPAG